MRIIDAYNHACDVWDRAIADGKPSRYVRVVSEACERLHSRLVEQSDDCYDDSMDGDHGSALASAGWGTDEDYGDGGW